MKAAEEDMTINCSREDSDLILENMFLEIELLIIGIHYLQNVLIVKLLILLRSTSRLYWSREMFRF